MGKRCGQISADKGFGKIFGRDTRRDCSRTTCTTAGKISNDPSQGCSNSVVDINISFMFWKRLRRAFYCYSRHLRHCVHYRFDVNQHHNRHGSGHRCHTLSVKHNRHFLKRERSPGKYQPGELKPRREGILRHYRRWG